MCQWLSIGGAERHAGACRNPELLEADERSQPIDWLLTVPPKQILE
jgi:hypothetical protein